MLFLKNVSKYYFFLFSPFPLEFFIYFYYNSSYNVLFSSLATLLRFSNQENNITVVSGSDAVTLLKGNNFLEIIMNITNPNWNELYNNSKQIKIAYSFNYLLIILSFSFSTFRRERIKSGEGFTKYNPNKFDEKVGHFEEAQTYFRQSNGRSRFSFDRLFH